MFTTSEPTSPLFIGLLLAVLVNVVLAWSGLVRGQLPNMTTSERGARVAGIFFLLSLMMVFISYYFYTYSGELRGSFALLIAGLLFIAGLVIAERIPE
ncbi:MAG: hypothetical protein KJ047_00065 [Anaerolineae bacterium]|nr:hypothetical protein [Anaerolineae bacterium]MEB2287634.1 hypothetical protein [Anaerolineae bacterium]